MRFVIIGPCKEVSIILCMTYLCFKKEIYTIAVVLITFFKSRDIINNKLIKYNIIMNVEKCLTKKVKI